MFDKLQEIIEGHRNHMFPPEKLREVIKEVSDKRLSICTPCEYNSTPRKIKFYSRCKNCGCPLIQKSKSLQSKCPIDKWPSLATDEEAHNIKITLNGEKNSPEGSSVETPDSN